MASHYAPVPTLHYAPPPCKTTTTLLAQKPKEGLPELYLKTAQQILMEPQEVPVGKPQALGMGRQTWFRSQLFHPLPVNNIYPPQFYPVLLGHNSYLGKF